MGKVSVFCIILVFALLLEDGSSVKKKTEKEEKEDEEIQKAVNATLAEEEKKRKEEEDEAKKKREKEKIKTKKLDEDKRNGAKQEDQDEACPICNCTCPTVKPCLPCHECPEVEHCPPNENCTEPEKCDPCQECPPVKECGPCPKVKPCLPCGPCPVEPLPCTCPGEGSMTIPVALAVGAMVSLLATGAAAAIGLLLRYTSPLFSGLLFVSMIVLTWYLSSRYPETAREIGGRVVAILREATSTLSHRVVEALRHHNNQVGFLIFLLIFFNFEFHVSLEKFALRFSM
jgi:hypothetical protein